jgi:serine/threonine protein kinase
MHLCRENPENRYTANEALNHPWITRNFTAPVPLTLHEELTQFRNTKDLLALERALLYVSLLSETQENSPMNIMMSSPVKKFLIIFVEQVSKNIVRF